MASTLCVTFLAGGDTGFAVNELKRPHESSAWSVDSVYGSELGKLKRRGYDESEMQRARVMYKGYFDEYDMWWNKFLETYPKNFDQIDHRFELQLQALDDEFRARVGATDEAAPGDAVPGDAVPGDALPGDTPK
jgi:hypothetical protein